MPDKDWEKLKELFHAAVALAPNPRAQYLDDVCRGNASLRQAVESLIQSHEKTGEFMDSPAFQAAAERLINDNELEPGQMIGHYEIRSVLGSGGMGKVYLAEDRKLMRNVALKVLPPEMLGNEDARRRLLREARAAAALDHPNICAIYEVGEDHSSSYIAMQYVEGETLDARMRRGEISEVEAIKIAIQVADALTAAHERNIIHRDIKPANLMLSHRGDVKVLDFGLAKLLPEAVDSAPEADSKTLLTQPGLIVGTVPYMSPEQARGKDIDAGSDIWSLGIVLYEMITGRTPFKGESNTDTLAAILNNEPAPLIRYAPEVKGELQSIVGKMLQKERDKRYHLTKDVRADLEVARERSSVNRSHAGEIAASTVLGETNRSREGGAKNSGHLTQNTSPLPSQTGRLAFAAIALIALAVIAFVVWRLPGKQGANNNPTLLHPAQVTNWTGLDIYPTLSPDGNSIAYSSDHNGNFEIFVKPLAPGSREIQITSDGQQNFEPAWSPDGQYIAFYSKNRGGIWLVPPSGGTVKQLARFGSHPNWSHDGRLIAFQSDPITALGAQAAPAQPPSTIWVVAANGNADPKQITKVGSPPGGHGAPSWSADGRDIVFCVSDFGATSIWKVASNGSNAKQIINPGYDPVYAPDGRSIYYASLTGLWRIRVAPASNEPLGEPFQLASGSSERIRYFAVSGDGKRLAYTALLTNSNIWAVPLAHGDTAPTGNPVPLTQDRTLRNALPAFSPDGKKIAFNTQKVSRESGEGDIWLMDADGRNATQVTTEGGGLANWFPNGEQLAFGSARDLRKAWMLNLKTGQDKPLLDFGEAVNYLRLSPDGNQIVYNSKKSGTTNVWKISLAGAGAKQLTFDQELIGFACWSPDGQTLGIQIKRGDDTNVGVMSGDGGAIRQLTFEKGQAWIYSFSPDGDKIAFAGFRNGVWNVWWVSRSTKQQKRLTNYTKLNSYVRYPAWSPLGNQIAYEYAETFGNIWVAELK